MAIIPLSSLHHSPIGMSSPCPPLAARKVISEDKGQCYRILNSGSGRGSCSVPILRNITKQICCCSRVGKAWGKNCERCPYFGSGEHPYSDSNLHIILDRHWIIIMQLMTSVNICLCHSMYIDQKYKHNM